MAEKSPQDAERTVVDARMDPELAEIVPADWPSSATLDERQRETLRVEDSATQAASMSEDPATIIDTVDAIASDDVVEEGIEADMEPPSTEPRTAGAAPEVPQPFAAQPTLVYREAASAPRLIVIGGNDRGREFVLERSQTTLGRATDNDIILSDIAVSRNHVALMLEGEEVRLLDLRSGNGTLVNGERVEGCVLDDGDQIEIGNTLVRFEHPRGSGNATRPGEAVVGAASSAPSRPVATSGVVGGTPVVSRPRPASTPPGAGLLPRLERASGRTVAIVTALVSLVTVGLIWRYTASPSALAPGVDEVFESAVRSFRASQFAEARKAFVRVLAAAPENPKARLYVERCDIEIAARGALDEARGALASHDYIRARAAIDRVDVASFAWEDARMLRAQLAAATAAPALPVETPRAAPPAAPAAVKRVAARSRPHTGDEDKGPPAVPIAGVQHYFAREWGPAYVAFKSAADGQKGKARERSLAQADEVRRAGQAFLRAEKDRSQDPAQAIREYEEALDLDQRLAFSHGHHGVYLTGELHRLLRAAAQAAFVAGNYEQSYQATRAAQRYGPPDPALGKISSDLDDKARELVGRGLAQKDRDPDSARQLFRRVLKFVPSSSAAYQKAYETLNGMARPREDEDE